MTSSAIPGVIPNGPPENGPPPLTEFAARAVCNSFSHKFRTSRSGKEEEGTKAVGAVHFRSLLLLKFTSLDLGREDSVIAATGLG